MGALHVRPRFTCSVLSTRIALHSVLCAVIVTFVAAYFIAHLWYAVWNAATVEGHPFLAGNVEKPPRCIVDADAFIAVQVFVPDINGADVDIRL